VNLDQRLLAADPASTVPADLGRSVKAQAALADITSTNPGGPRTSRGQRRPWGRYGLAAAATAIGVMVAPVLGSGTAAFAWTATPRAATAAESATWGSRCLETWKGDHGYRVRLVEVRGPWVYTVLAGADDYEATCLANTDPDGEEGSSGGFAAPLSKEPLDTSLVTNSVRDLDAGVPGVHQMEVTGRAGSDVTAITFRVKGGDVKATIRDGYFAAWWPQYQGRSLLARITPDGPPDPEVVVSLVDGTTRTARIQDFDVSPL
jgi:hypothetical protein